GKSLGGGIAVELAVRFPKCRCLILAKTFDSVTAAANRLLPLLPLGRLLRTRFDNLSKMSSLRLPVLLAQGDADHLFPVKIGQALFDQAPELKRLIVLRDHGHDDPLDDEFFSAVKEFLPARE
ncbi:MAG: alpha/beta hydrolase, partial [Planctomycetales bacterium]